MLTSRIEPSQFSNSLTGFPYRSRMSSMSMELMGAGWTILAPPPYLYGPTSMSSARWTGSRRLTRLSSNSVVN